MGEISYRRALKSDYPAINDFYNRIYGRNRSMEEFEWEFHNSPAGPSVYIVAVDDSAIVGTNCVIQIDLIHSDGGHILSGKSEDTLVDPNYRGKRIFANIYEKLIEECKNEGIEVIWGFTPVDKAFKKIGFDIPFSNTQSLAVLNVTEAFRYLSHLNPKNVFFDKLKIFGLTVMSKFKVSAATRSKDKTVQLIERKGPANLDEVIVDELSCMKGGLAINQGTAYQKWRYSDNPHLFDPHYLEFSRNDEPIGYASVNITTDKVCYISEVKFHLNVDDDSRKSAVQSLLVYIKDKGACLVRNWHFGTNQIGKREIRVFEQSGFTILHRGSHFVWMDLTNSAANPSNFILTRAATQGLK